MDHPTQTLANFLTLQENIDKPLNEISYAYVGHGQSNMCNALMSGAAKMGMDFRLIGPKQYWPVRQNNQLMYLHRLDQNL